MSRMERVATLVCRRRRTVVAVVLVATLLIGLGAPTVELATSLDEFRGGTEAAAADEYVRSEFGVDQPNTSRAMLVMDADVHLLNRRYYMAQFRAQQAMFANETVNRTLAPEEPPIGMANIVATISIRKNFSLVADDNPELAGNVRVPRSETSYENVTFEPMPPLAEQIQEIREMSRLELQLYTTIALETVLAEPGHGGPEGGTFAMVPPGEFKEDDGGVVETTTMIVTQRDAVTSEQRAASQVAMQEIVQRELGNPDIDVRIFGTGVINDELERSTRDSLLLVGPLALLFVIAVLYVAYRDWPDIILGLVGLALVQVWTFGFMGWMNITFNQLFAAAPVLLVGLAIDYAIHTFMRYREARTAPGPDLDARGAMATALGGLLAALSLVTISTAIGFSSNVTSPVPPIRDFGLVTTVGIVASLVVFGILTPAIKIEVDQWLEARGHDRQLRPFGEADGRGDHLADLLDRSVAAAQAVPWTVVALTGLAVTAGVAGGLQVDTAFDEEELLVHDVPAWAAALPAPFAPAEYHVADTLTLIEDRNLVHDGSVAHVLVRGSITDATTLERVARAERRASESEAVLQPNAWQPNGSTGETFGSPEGNPAVITPLTVMRDAATEYRSFNRTFHRADTDGNGVPDRNLTAVYDELYDDRPVAAASVIRREDGEYDALRLSALAPGHADNSEISREMQAVAAPVDGDGLRAIPTGEPVMLAVVTAGLLETIVQSMVITLVTVLALLVLVYWRYRGSATLGVVTLLPVLVALTWIVGTMHLLDIPFNVMTALITSFTIGLGVDYSIHVSERYVLELRRHESSGAALRTSVIGTGGALLGSATTTAIGFGVLAFSILNPLQQFGIVTALTIVYSFIASVVVLPSLLVLWTRHLRPAGHADRRPAAADD